MVRKSASWGVAIAVVLGTMALTSSPASAKSRRHRHHHHHHHTTPTTPQVTCGPGTVLVGGACLPTGSTNPGGSSPGGSIGGFPGSGGVTISPSSASLTPAAPPVANQGSFAGTFTMSGVPGTTSFTASASGVGCTIVQSPAVTVASSSSGQVSFGLASTSALCRPGIYTVNVTETGAPGATFTAFVNVNIGGLGGF